MTTFSYNRIESNDLLNIKNNAFILKGTNTEEGRVSLVDEPSSSVERIKTKVFLGRLQIPTTLRIVTSPIQQCAYY
jgi:hypothetical protein